MYCFVGSERAAVAWCAKGRLDIDQHVCVSTPDTLSNLRGLHGLRFIFVTGAFAGWTQQQLDGFNTARAVLGAH